jgi:hypothetical protein
MHAIALNIRQQEIPSKKFVQVALFVYGLQAFPSTALFHL